MHARIPLLVSMIAVAARGFLIADEEPAKLAADDPRLPVLNYYNRIVNDSGKRDWTPHLRNLHETKALIDDDHDRMAPRFDMADLFDFHAEEGWAVVFAADDEGRIVIGPEVVYKTNETWERNLKLSLFFHRWHQKEFTLESLRAMLDLDFFDVQQEDIDQIAKIADWFSQNFPMSANAPAQVQE